RRIARHREGAVNVACGAASFLPVFALNAALTLNLMYALYDVRLFDVGQSAWAWVGAYVAYDLASFVVHLASHKVRLLWIFHSVHHAPEEMKASVSFRGSLGDFLITPHTTLWLPLLGFHPLMIVVVEGLGLLWGVALHMSEDTLRRPGPRWLGLALITPALHRVHHGRNGLYLDTNYGLTLSLWDRLCGTFQAPMPEEPVAYGLVDPHATDRFIPSQMAALDALRADLRAADGWRERLGYLFRAPGWRPGGGGKTARALRAEALSELAR
ncbi:MAG: sterol desaturase family protein, partial [Myxococcales bacterium]|nr:sterol desaturase family protein [Myxococcales bacterium]